jgi:hypothetical protein
MGAHRGFTLIIMFMGFDWKPKHVTFSLFEIINIIKHALVRNLIDLLKIYELRLK